MTAALSKTGERRLAEAEAKIEQGLSTFWEVGSALMQIRDERLYRAEFSTFEDYCQERWGMTRRRANQLVEAATLGTMVPISNERQARALAPVKEDPAEVREAYAQAAAEGDTSGAGLARVVKRRKAATTSTTETVTFDPVEGFTPQPPADENGEPISGGGAVVDPSGDVQEPSTEQASPAPSPVPQTVTCPTCHGSGLVAAEAS